jgi:DNA-binding MarR family transcriptional regulator
MVINKSSNIDYQSISFYIIGMTTSAINSGLPIATQVKYRDNFARHILSVNVYIQSEIMKTLTEKHGHTALRINFEPYIMIAGDSGARLSDIADVLGISRQAANHYANQIERAGYLERKPDPSDGRAKLLIPTARARTLMRQGAREAAKFQKSFTAMVGEEALRGATRGIRELNQALGLLLPFEFAQNAEPNLAAVLPRLANYVTHRLQGLTMARGHSALKPSFASVLAAIGPGGGRIQHMADTQAVSKQAISAVASELEDLGYIERRPDPGDARQLILVFSPSGCRLIEDSVSALDELEQELSRLLGREGFNQLTDTLRQIYQSLHLEEDVFGSEDSDDIIVLAKQLIKRLGDDGARALAKLILADQNNTRLE